MTKTLYGGLCDCLQRKLNLRTRPAGWENISREEKCGLRESGRMLSEHSLEGMERGVALKPSQPVCVPSGHLLQAASPDYASTHSCPWLGRATLDSSHHIL